MKDDTKKVLAVHDLSGFGRCALTVIIPVLSSMGICTVPLPTALLSTHTGGFTDLAFHDLSYTMEPALRHYKSLDLTFDAIYTGFLGSAGQIDTVSHSIEMFGDGITVLVDPVMGDDGKVYQTYTEEMCRRMRELCHKANIITPNLTEAYLLCGEEYCDTSLLDTDSAIAEAERLRMKLSSLYGVEKIALTGIELPNGNIATISYDKLSENRESFHIIHKIECGYPGTGDLFASALLGKILDGMDFHSSVDFACQIVAETIDDTSKYDTPRREGLRLEKNLYRLTKK